MVNSGVEWTQPTCSLPLSRGLYRMEWNIYTTHIWRWNKKKSGFLQKKWEMEMDVLLKWEWRPQKKRCLCHDLNYIFKGKIFSKINEERKNVVVFAVDWLIIVVVAAVAMIIRVYVYRVCICGGSHWMDGGGDSEEVWVCCPFPLLIHSLTHSVRGRLVQQRSSFYPSWSDSQCQLCSARPGSRSRLVTLTVCGEGRQLVDRWMDPRQRRL